MINGIGIAAREVEARRGSGRAAMPDFAATFRDSDQNVVGTTWAGTICWAPRKPSAFAAYSTERDEETIIRCGHCIGCREFDRQRLVRRLDSLYRDSTEKIWAINFESSLNASAALLSRVRRTIGSESYRGFFRTSPVGCVVLVSFLPPTLRALVSRLARSATISRVRTGRGKRAWRAITVGMLVPRDEYGEQRNRFYSRGLPPALKESWTITTRGGIGKRAPGARAGIRSRRGDVSLMPPVAWKPPKLIFARGLYSRRFAKPSPIAQSIAEVILGLRVAPASVTTPVKRGAVKRPLPAPSISGFRTARSASALPDTDISLEMAGYRSSRQSDRAEIDAWLVRMQSKRRDGP